MSPLISREKLVILCTSLFSLFAQPLVAQEPIAIALAGLSHDHVNGVLQQYKSGKVKIIGIAEKDDELISRIRSRYTLPDSVFFKDLPTLLKHVHPAAVLAFNPISEHLAVVEACAPLHIHVMVEKPLAVTVKQAERIVALAAQYKIQVLTNYETTWYASNQYIQRKVHDSAAVGDIRKMVVHDGHEGPKEIGVSKESFQWLTDPETNGAGALVDFGCYGANLMTWLMNGTAPLAVTAIVKHIKPAIYPKVDDDATIVLEYPKATGIIEASWNWPFSIKDLEVFGVKGYLQAVNSNTIRSRESNQPYVLQTLPAPSPPYRDYIAYLTAVLRNQIDPQLGLSSLQNNLIVVKILEAAIESAKTGKRVELTPNPTLNLKQ